MDERKLQIVLSARDEASKTINKEVADSTDSLSNAFERHAVAAGTMAVGVLGALDDRI